MTLNLPAQCCAYCAHAEGTVSPPDLRCGITGRGVVPWSCCHRPFERAPGSDDNLGDAE